MKTIIDVTYLPEEITAKQYHRNNHLHIVVDILRASATIIALLEAGAQWVKPFMHFEKAYEMYARGEMQFKKIEQEKNRISEPGFHSSNSHILSSLNILLVGERQGKKIPNFHFGNSPVEIIKNKEDIKNKVIFFSTTNGTKTIEQLKNHSQICLGSFLNLSALINFVFSKNPDYITIHCAGSAGQISLEDLFFAGLFIEFLINKNEGFSVKMYDGAKIAHSFVINSLREDSLPLEEKVYRTVSESAHGKYLQKLGFIEDIKFCTRIDWVHFVPVYLKEEDIIIKG